MVRDLRRRFCRRALVVLITMSGLLATQNAQASWTPGATTFSANGPMGVDVDPADGSVWVVGHNDHQVHKFSARGVRLLTLGGFGTGTGQFNSPSALAVGPGGDVYVTDVGNNRVQRFTTAGSYVRSYGGNGALENPLGIDVDASGNVYVGDVVHGLRKFAPTGALVHTYPASVATQAYAVAVGPDGSIWVSDFGPDPDVVRKVDPATDAVLLQIGGLGQPVDIEVGDDGRVHVADFNAGAIKTYSEDGTLVETTGGLASPLRIALDEDGRLLLAGPSGVQRLNPTPVSVVQYTGAGGVATVDAAFAAATAAHQKEHIDFEDDGFDGLAPHTWTPIPDAHYGALGVTLIGLDARHVGTSPFTHSLPVGAWQRGFSAPPAPYSFVFDDPVASFGMFANDVEAQVGVTVHLVGGGVEFFTLQTTNSSNPSMRFFGFVAGSGVIERIDFDSFDYHIIDDVQFGTTNAPPDAQDDEVVTDEDSSVTIHPLVNDTDPDGDALVIDGVSGSTGSTTMTDDSITFQPAPNACGVETLSYGVQDPSGASDTASIVVTVDCVPDPPTALDDVVGMAQGTTLVHPNLLERVSDPDQGDTLTLTSVSATVGTASTDGSAVTFTPPIGFCGSTTPIAYTASDGSASASATLHVLVSCLDGDGDGVADTIGNGTGSFLDPVADSPDTSGSIVLVPPGFSVLVEDLPDPDGVRIRVDGSGTERVVLSVCGGFTLRLVAGSDIDVTCGSVRIDVAAGQAEVVLSDDTGITVDAGGAAKIAATGGDTYAVTDVSGAVTLTADGVARSLTGATTVTVWDFVGFSAPVDNPTVLNVVKAGRAIPLKWRLLDESGNPVTDLSGVSLRVAPLSCPAGAAADVVEEVVASGSGLQNLGDGYYQLNWKTSTGYAGSCRTLHLDLGEGITRTALFHLTR